MLYQLPEINRSGRQTQALLLPPLDHYSEAPPTHLLTISPCATPAMRPCNCIRETLSIHPSLQAHLETAALAHVWDLAGTGQECFSLAVLGVTRRKHRCTLRILAKSQCRLNKSQHSQSTSYPSLSPRCQCFWHAMSVLRFRQLSPVSKYR